MSDKITAPFTLEQVLALFIWQTNLPVHPFTCGGDHPGDHVILLPTKQGWICPVESCDYTQDWAHDFMVDPETARVLGRSMYPNWDAAS